MTEPSQPSKVDQLPEPGRVAERFDKLQERIGELRRYL